MRPRLHVIRNNVEKVTLDVGGSTESVFTSWMCKYEIKCHLQKRDLQLKESTRLNKDVGRFWTWRRWDWAYVNHDLFNVITYYVKSGTRIAEQTSNCVYKAHIYALQNFPNFSLNNEILSFYRYFLYFKIPPINLHIIACISVLHKCFVF